MHLHPILRSLSKQKGSALLVVLELGLCLAIFCNAVHLISLRRARIARETGLATEELLHFRVISPESHTNTPTLEPKDLQEIRELPGVRSASTVNSVPFGGTSMNGSIHIPGQETQARANAAIYAGGEGIVDTMGLKLIAGRDFEPQEWVDSSSMPCPLPSAIISQSMAKRLFGDRNPLGAQFSLWGDNDHRVVGVVEHLIRPGDREGATSREYTVLFPVRFPSARLLVRTDRDSRRDVLKDVVKIIQDNDPRRVVHSRDLYSDMVDAWYQRDRSMIWLLSGVTALLILVTALGIIGLVSFWVQKRSKEIGIRRALGARRQDIFCHFLLENLILTTLGVILGMALALGINRYLMLHYELPGLPIAYLPIGAVAILLLGQAAVLWPAWRSTGISPASATRSL